MSTKLIYIILFLCAGVGLWSSLSRRESFGVAAPTVDSTTVSETSGGSETSMSLIENTTKTVYIAGQITDTDGCDDVATNGTVTGKFCGAVGCDCSADNNDCYVIGNGACSKTGCNPPSDNSFNYECTAAIQYYADSTTAGPYSNSNWTARITATDAALLTGTRSGTIEMNTLLALNLSATSITYGELTLGQESAQKSLTITNTGNSGIDLDLSVNGAMTCSLGTISATATQYSSSTGFSFGNGTALSASATEFELSLAQLTNDTASSSKDLFFKLKIPDIGVGGACSNTMTVTAKADTENGW